jgi:uroporphyrinogen decarboxylase
VRPFDLALLQAVRERGGTAIIHAHGARVYFDRVLDYPVHAISWADRAGGPSLREARALTGTTLMGGIAHGNFQYTTAAAVRAEVRSAIAEAGRERLLLAPGCSLATYTFPDLIRAARDEARR